MIVNRPYRSAMCSGCHGVGPARSATSGTSSSSATSTRSTAVWAAPSNASIATQPTSQIVIPTAYRRAVAARSPWRDARSHWNTSATRMIR